MAKATVEELDQDRLLIMDPIEAQVEGWPVLVERLALMSRLRPHSNSKELLSRIHTLGLALTGSPQRHLVEAAFHFDNAESLDFYHRVHDSGDAMSLSVQIAELGIDRASAGEKPNSSGPAVVAVMGDLEALVKLKDLLERVEGRICYASPGSPDIMVNGGDVRIIDQQYLGECSWESFAHYLREVNSPVDPAEIDDPEVYSDLVALASLRDSPLIILPGVQPRIYSEPIYATGPVYYVPTSRDSAWHQRLLLLVSELLQIPLEISEDLAKGGSFHARFQ